MSKLDLGPIGIALDITEDGSHLDHAAEVEKLGYATIWIAGGQIDSLDRISELVRATEKIVVAPGIIPLDVYDAASIAAFYADIEASHPGRVLVGIGGPQRPKALAPLNAALDELDAADPPVPASRRILAALGPKKLALARDRFAGAVPLLVTPAYTAQAREILGPDSTLVIDQLTALETDPERGRAATRETVGFLLGVGGYVENVRRMGFNDDDIGELSDRLIDAITTWGDAETIAARVGEHLEAGADQVVVGGIEVARATAPLLLG